MNKTPQPAEMKTKAYVPIHLAVDAGHVEVVFDATLLKDFREAA